MNTTITKREIEAIIDRLADKSHFDRCNVERGYCCSGFGRRGAEYPILLSDVLDKLERGIDFFDQSIFILDKWGCPEIGLKVSLQSIYSAMKFENVAVPCPDGEKTCETFHTAEVALPSPQADLFIFLKNLGL